MTPNDRNLLGKVRRYYEDKLHQHGPTHAGVDWNSEASQVLRFQQLLKVCETDKPFSLLDYGCGYGALALYMAEQGYRFEYIGYDISPEMLSEAKTRLQKLPHCRLVGEENALPVADYTVASGLFNVKLETDNATWRQYILDTLAKMAAHSRRGFSFNVLTKYSDAEYMRDRLYYADPCFLFDHCKRHFSRNVALLHDYDLYEFTILVRL